MKFRIDLLLPAMTSADGMRCHSQCRNLNLISEKEGETRVYTCAFTRNYLVVVDQCIVRDRYCISAQKRVEKMKRKAV